MDGGLDIPHSDKRFAGFSKDKKELDPEVHRKYIYGGHVAAYMKAWKKISFDAFPFFFPPKITRNIMTTCVLLSADLDGR